MGEHDSFLKNAEDYLTKENYKFKRHDAVTEKDGFTLLPASLANQVYSDKNIDCVYICTPTDKHFDIVENCVRNAKTVMCEKPISCSNRDTIKCYQLARNANVGLFCAFNRRYDP